MDMTFTEAADYIAKYDINGITLTEAGRGAALAILDARQNWTGRHTLMLYMVRNGISPLPFKLERVVARTRLGDAIALVRDLSRKHIKNQKARARRKARKSRFEKDEA